MSSIRIELLTKSHDRKAFDCGEPSLSRYIQQFAIHKDARNIGRTFVAVRDRSPQILGYYTLATGRISFATMPSQKRLPPNVPIPVIRLGRLAVDPSCQGTELRLGETLLLHALWRCGQINKEWRSMAWIYGQTPFLGRPVDSSMPSMRFMFWIAWPAAPFTKLSITLAITAYPVRSS